MSEQAEYKLCCIDGTVAYFTTRDVSEQWGDDWNDAPYEHNAGGPYAWGRYDAKEGIPEWYIKEVAFWGPLVRPCDGVLNSMYSVQMINRGEVPWLRVEEWRGIGKVLYAGATIDEFVQFVKDAGGVILEIGV